MANAVRSPRIVPIPCPNDCPPMASVHHLLPSDLFYTYFMRSAFGLDSQVECPSAYVVTKSFA